MENVIYNELIARDFDVDVGVVEYNYKEDEKSYLWEKLFALLLVAAGIIITLVLLFGWAIPYNMAK